MIGADKTDTADTTARRSLRSSIATAPAFLGASRVNESLNDTQVDRISRALVQGDAAALATLYESRFEWMLKLIQAATRKDESFAFDCLQDAWMRVARAPVHCSSAAALDGWLRRVALTAALDRLRSNAARRMREVAYGSDTQTTPRAANAATMTATVTDSAPSELVAAMESIDTIRAALARAMDDCSPDERGLLMMRFRAGMTIAQIAAACGIGAAAIDSRLRRLIASMRVAIKESGPEPTHARRATAGVAQKGRVSR